MADTKVVGGDQPIGAVTDRTIDGPGGPLTLRFYTPRGLTGDAPALVYVHGGAWIYGDLESHDAVCRFLAEEAQVRVIAVDYRLAPEAPFPAAFEDVWAAWTWIAEHAKGIGVDPTRIAVGGDSAGGCMAALVAQHAAKDEGIKPAFQLLIYPVTDFLETSASRKTVRRRVLPHRGLHEPRRGELPRSATRTGPTRGCRPCSRTSRVSRRRTS